MHKKYYNSTCSPLYSSHHRGDHYYDDGHRTHYHAATVLFREIFSKSKSKFNPREKGSPWFWAQAPGAPHPYDHTHARQKYDHVSLISLPYASPGRPGGERALINYEALSITFQSFPLPERRYGSTGHIAMRVRYSCETFANEHHPFPQELVTDAQDDLRLGTCMIGLTNRPGQPGALRAGMALTNKGIWAFYSVFPETVDGKDNDGFTQVCFFARLSDRFSTAT